MNHSQKVPTTARSSLKNSTWNQLTSKIPNMTCTQMKVFIFLLSWWQKLISDSNFVLMQRPTFCCLFFPKFVSKNKQENSWKIGEETAWLTGGDNQFSFAANGVELRAEDWVTAGDVGTIDLRMLKVGDSNAGLFKLRYCPRKKHRG